jgi:hypothetical protein
MSLWSRCSFPTGEPTPERITLTSTSGPTEEELGRGPPAVRPVVRSMRERAGELVAGARDERVALTEDGGLTSMVREVLQAGLDVEMTEHRGYHDTATTDGEPVTAATAATGDGEYGRRAGQAADASRPGGGGRAGHRRQGRPPA